MMRIHPRLAVLCLTIAAAFVAAFNSCFESCADIGRSIYGRGADFLASCFRPHANEALALDRLTRPVAVLPAARARVRSFIDRLASHDLFTSGRFAPDPMIS